jgi:putative acetyltransferase
MIKSIEGNFDHPEVNELLIKHFIELRSVSPDDSCHVLDIAGLKDPSIKFWSLWENNELMGSGALKILDQEHGEFKSIRVNDKFRNKGYGSKLINHLIDEAKKLNIRRLSLETGAGEFFMPARKLFTRCGFRDCEPFSDYKKNVNSIYLTKLINNNN